MKADTEYYGHLWQTWSSYLHGGTLLDGKFFERRDYMSVAPPGYLVYIEGIQIIFTRWINNLKYT